MLLFWIPVLLWTLSPTVTTSARIDEDESNYVSGSDEDKNYESFEIETRQDLGYYKCLTKGACSAACIGRDYWCDYSKGICACMSGVKSVSKNCALAPADSKCSRQYTDCVSQNKPFDKGQPAKYLCTVDSKQTEKLCVHDAKLGFDRCQNDQVCQVVCKDGFGQCDVIKGICTCSTGLGSALSNKCTDVGKVQGFETMRCYEYGGRYATKYFCQLEDMKLCVHALYQSKECRPIGEVCGTGTDCCQGSCKNSACAVKASAPTDE